MITMQGVNDEGRRTQMDIHLADGVKQLLLSIAQMNDVSNIAVFDSTGAHHGSRLVKADTEAGQAIRDAVRAATNKREGTPIERIQNTYYMNMWVRRAVDTVKRVAKGFTRQES